MDTKVQEWLWSVSSGWLGRPERFAFSGCLRAETEQIRFPRVPDQVPGPEVALSLCVSVLMKETLSTPLWISYCSPPYHTIAPLKPEVQAATKESQKQTNLGY